MDAFLVFLAGAGFGAAASALATLLVNRRRPGRRDAVLSKLAHDLRTPLSSVTAYSELLSDDDGIDPEERARFAGIIHQEALRMETMIENRLGEEKSRTQAAPPVRVMTPAPPGPSRTILVVDDDRFLVEATRTLLTREGFVAVGASGGEEALSEARALRPDLILMDLSMPGMTGEEILRLLRDDAATREIPVIITTGDDDVTDLAGAAMVLTKPVTRERLLSAIAKAGHPARQAHQSRRRHA